MKNKILKTNTLITSVAALALLALSGCESMAHFYPANAQAQHIGPEITAHFTTFGTGNGTIDAIGPNGEVMKGSYNPAPKDYAFGGIFKEVYGQFSTLPTAADNGTATVASLTGNLGTTMKCEFYNDDYTGNGFGGCKTLTGALYRLQY